MDANGTVPVRRCVVEMAYECTHACQDTLFWRWLVVQDERNGRFTRRMALQFKLVDFKLKVFAEKV
jgi:hypothetical protein